MTAPSKAIAPDLLGRQEQVAIVGALLDRSANGVGGIVLVEGDPGIGKTSLLDHTTRAARALGGWTVRTAVADELEGERPYSLVTAAFPELRGRLTGPGAGSGGMQLAMPTRIEMADATAALAEELRAAGPVLLVVDDLQWADGESMFALAALARRATVLGIAVVGAMRTQARSTALARLLEVSADAGGEHLVLPPLGAADAQALATTVLGSAPPDALGAHLANAGGNPWLIVELARHAASVPPGTAVDTVPPGVQQVVARRVDALSTEAAGLVRIASVLGQRFRLRELERLTGTAPGPLAVAMAIAVEAGLLEDDGEHLSFRHDLVRQSLEASLPGSVCAALHREAAAVLRDLGADPLEVAPHITRGALPGDEHAFEWLVEAAKAAEPTSAGAAADLLGHAARLCVDDAKRDDVDAVRARFLVWGGRPGEASALCTELAARVADPDVLADALAVKARALFLLGRPGEAAALVETGVGRDRPGAGISEQLGHAELALVTLFAGDHRRALGIAAHVLARPALEPAAASLARSVRCWGSALAGDLDGAVADGEAAVALAHDDPTGVAFRYHPHLFQAVLLNAVTDTPGALLAIRTGRAIGARLTTGWDRAMYDWAEAVVAFHAGRWQDALALGEAGSLAADESGLVLGASWHTAIAAVVALRTGDVDECERRLAVELVPGAAGQLGLEWLAWAQGLRAERAGDLDGAVMFLGGTWRVAQTVGADSVLGLIGSDVLRVARGAGNLDLAHEVAAELARIAARGRLAADLHAGRAEHAAAVLGAPDLDRFVAACDHLRRGHRPYELAEALHDASVACAVAGDRTRARSLGREAMALYGEMGAAPDVARLRAALRAEGVAMRQHEARSAATSGWESLTRSERGIVELVAQGLSNAQIAEQLFVSRRTVESHLVHVYPKLGARSRVELARLVAEHVTVPVRSG